ncbi:hypothetical protein [Nitratidesulfovibrio liaohensis]|uniref:hypothetical protein n=1 Tax=Nitratidesulfovibrio liaohensis TaxID=2604158 RepID=UPI001422AECE|nr:hypothetical protein [Nitratidesulfovibrio liaohensis]NHZ48381.1 hypothetical protein [Nitratidesulfovibrio liaohensis]
MQTDGKRRGAPVHLLLLLACLLTVLPARFAAAAGDDVPQAAASVAEALPASVPGVAVPSDSTSADFTAGDFAPSNSVPAAPAASDSSPSGSVTSASVTSVAPATAHMPNFGDQPATDGARGLYAEAVRVLSQVRSTRYTGSYVVDEETGRFELNCSGFLSLLLYEVNPSALATVDRSGKHYRPRAEDFHRSILRAGPKGDGTGWLRLERVSDLRPGDVVAWLRPAERSASSATGHVMVALASPRLNPARPGEVLLPVADCTLSPHGDLAAMRGVGSPESEAVRAAPPVGEPAVAPSSELVAGQAMEQASGHASELALAPVPGSSLEQPRPPQVEAPPVIAPGLERGSPAWLAALPRDTREPGIGGVGSGVIGLATDATGHPVAYWWRGGVSRHRLVTSIMLGRLE